MAKKTLRSAEADETMDRAAEAVPAPGADGAETTPDAPKKRAPRRKAAADAPDASDSDTAEAPARKPRAPRKKAAEATAEDAETPVKKPRAPRKKADAEPAELEAPVADESAEEAPRRRRTRSTRDAEPVASSDRLPDDVVAEASRDDGPHDDAPRDRRRPTRQIDLTTNRSRDDQSRDTAPRDTAPRDTAPRDTAPRDTAPRDDRSSADRPERGRDDRPRDDRGYEEDGGRRKRKRNRNKNKNRDGQPQGNPNQGGPQGGGQPQGGNHGGQPQSGGQPQGSSQPQAVLQNQGGGHPGEPFEGMLELIGDKKFGFIRTFSASLLKGDNDPFMPPPLIQKYGLRDGILLKGFVKPGRKGAMQVTEVTEVMGGDPDAWTDVPDFEDGLVIYPEEKLNLVTGPQDMSMRVVDLVAPLGKGQRALIVAPPRAGKTILLKQIAAGLAANHPEVTLVALLIDERPEEVTDFRRNTECLVFASSNDAGEDNHVRVATLAFEYSRRLVEQGKDVVVLLDSLTRLGRTFNLFGGNYSGRTMSGGLDARALLMPRKIFGSARNIENRGSLTIVATALVETGSRMDEVIFEEFKGTGNSEIVLDRELSEKRIYPAINIRKSGTRNEERLVPEEFVRQRHMLLRALNSRHPVEAMQALGKQIQLSPSNEALLNDLVPETA